VANIKKFAKKILSQIGKIEREWMGGYGWGGDEVTEEP